MQKTDESGPHSHRLYYLGKALGSPPPPHCRASCYAFLWSPEVSQSSESEGPDRGLGLGQAVPQMVWSHPQVTAGSSDSLGQGSPRASAVWRPAQRAVLPPPWSSSSRFGPGRWAHSPEIVSRACQLGPPPESLPSGLGWAGVAGEQRVAEGSVSASPAPPGSWIKYKVRHDQICAWKTVRGHVMAALEY